MAATSNMTVEELNAKFPPKPLVLEDPKKMPGMWTIANPQIGQVGQPAAVQTNAAPNINYLDLPGVRLPGAPTGAKPGGVYADLQRQPDDTAGSLLHRKVAAAYGRAVGGVAGAVQGVTDPIVKFGADTISGVPNITEKGRAEIAVRQTASTPTPTINDVGGASSATDTGPGVWGPGDNPNQRTLNRDGAVIGSVALQPGTGTGTPSNPRPDYKPSITDLGNQNIRAGTVGGGTTSFIPMQSAAEMEASTKVMRDSRMERMAAQDGREYDPATGHMKGLDGPPLIIGQTGGVGLLDNDYESRRRMRMELDNARPGKGEAELAAAKAATYASKGQLGDIKLQDLIDMQQLQETGRHNQMRELGDAEDRALTQRRDQMDMGYKRADLQLRSATAGAQLAESQQKLIKGKQEELEAELTQAGLPEHINKYARGAAARFTGVPTNLLLIAIQRAAAAPTDTPDGLWGAIVSGKKKTFGELSALSQDEVDSTGKVTKQGSETAFETKVREQLAGMMK